MKTVSTLLKNMLEQPFEEKFRKINLGNTKILSILKNNIKLIKLFKEFKFVLVKPDSGNKSNISSYVNKAFQNDKSEILNYFI